MALVAVVVMMVMVRGIRAVRIVALVAVVVMVVMVWRLGTVGLRAVQRLAFGLVCHIAYSFPAVFRVFKRRAPGFPGAFPRCRRPGWG